MEDLKLASFVVVLFGFLISEMGIFVCVFLNFYNGRPYFPHALKTRPNLIPLNFKHLYL